MGYRIGLEKECVGGTGDDSRILTDGIGIIYVNVDITFGYLNTASFKICLDIQLFQGKQVDPTRLC